MEIKEKKTGLFHGLVSKICEIKWRKNGIVIRGELAGFAAFAVLTLTQLPSLSPMYTL